MHNTGFKVIQVVYKRLGCIEEGRASHSVCVSFEPMSESNTLLKLNRNSKVLRESYKNLLDI